jgi:hypothetical protein
MMVVPVFGESVFENIIPIKNAFDGIGENTFISDRTLRRSSEEK